MRKATRGLIKEGADFIKVIATGGSTLTSYPYRPAFGVDELKAIGAEAHNQGRFVGAHCRSNQGMRNVLEAGFEVIYHAFFMDEEAEASYDADIVGRIVQQGVWVNPTMHIGRSGIWALEAKRDAGRLTLEEEAKLSAGYEHRKARLEQCARMVDAGVRLIAGSDCGWGSYPFGQLAYEIECMVDGGLSPMQGIQSATIQAAQALGIGDSVGVLAPGKQADLLVVEGDPSENILDLMKVQAVFKGGERVLRGLGRTVHNCAAETMRQTIGHESFLLLSIHVPTPVVLSPPRTLSRPAGMRRSRTANIISSSQGEDWRWEVQLRIAQIERLRFASMAVVLRE